jgi:hypothetical protein
MLLDKATGANGITQEKYITITVAEGHRGSYGHILRELERI